MTFDKDNFTELCRAAAEDLRADPEAVSRGEQFVASGVWCQIYHRAERHCAVLIYNLGDPDPATELQLYRELLQIQSIFAGNVEAMFIRDPINETLLYTAVVPLTEGLTGADFADAVRRNARQVAQWRGTLLKGLFFDYERLAEQLLAGADVAPEHVLEI